MTDLDARNAELNKKLDATDLPGAVATLQLADRRRKIQIAVIAFSLLLDFMLTIGLFYQGHLTRQLANQAETNKNAIVARCEINNENRAKNKVLWDYVLALPHSPLSTEQQETRDKFQALVNDTFKPTDCKPTAET